jgi:lipoprotein signal peptidase
MVAVGCTLALYSFLDKDNALFKVAEHVYVGVAAAYVFGITWYNSLYGEIIVSYFDIGAEGSTGGGHNPWVLLFPTLLGLLMLTRFSRKFSWLSRISFAFVVGVGAGLTIPRFMSSFLLGQLEPSLAPLSLSWEGLNLFLVLVGVITVLVYFFFSVEHKGAVGHASRLGIWFLMVSFGASFGYTIMARLSLLIGRISFLLDDWLHVM